MSGDDLPEIVVPSDALVTRNLPAPTASPWADFPERPDKVWVVAAHSDGSLYAIEIPQPEGITVESDRKVYEDDDKDFSFWVRDRVLPDPRPMEAARAGRRLRRRPAPRRAAA